MVWQQKLGVLLKDLNEGVLGRMEPRIYVVVFQKRGLPHAHILIILYDDDKPRTPETIDKLLSAELPDVEANSELYKTVMTCTMHGPCGAANSTSTYMKDGKCTKGFPKLLVEVTRVSADDYPLYRRRRRAGGVLKFEAREYDNKKVN
ncbi:hypothetical protein PI124_g7643 [Phytophthora idaei]|nr:hypothetical protein PI125_g23581 [Phytophthora idaei]KAG3128256.1 hypothetical protein PI126_g21478 [Phytophthora idaei]KAG3247651.1 hypothetical protein PI124_g7643 [Phytophthora idaei]